MDGMQFQKYPDSCGPDLIDYILYETRVQATLNNQTCVKGYAVSCGRKTDSCKRVCGFVWTEG